MKIDIFAHILPEKYIEYVDKNTNLGGHMKEEAYGRSPTTADLDYRFRIMDKYEGYVQVLTVPQFHRVIPHPKAVDISKMANDTLAELVYKYPDHFVGAVACLPWNNVDESLKEIDRAINDLKFRGVEIWTPVDGKPIDIPELMPIYQKMCEYNLPIWIHPIREKNYPDYRGEIESKYRIFSTFGWVYETTAAMTRLVFSKVLQQFPNIKFITHHCGAMVPYLADRIFFHANYNEMRRREKEDSAGFTRHPIEYYRMFYNDTAINGNTPGLMCSYAFFGAEHLLFGTDMPLDATNGDASIRGTIKAIEGMNIPDSDKKKIFEDNSRQIMRLPV